MHDSLRLPPLILASVSPRRADLLREMGLKFIVVPSNAPELAHEQLTGAETAQVNAYRKARYVAKQHPDALVIGADTVVCADLFLFGKPADRDHAIEMLLQLQGRPHQVITAVCLLHSEHTNKTFL
jgi:septum formation protein